MLTIIGCGNANRRDDAVGVHVARRLRERLDKHPVPGVRALDCGTAGFEVMFAAKDSDAVILVDASVSGSEPGAVFEVPGAELVRAGAPAPNLHAFRWDDALHVGSQLYGASFPSVVTVFLVEAADTGLGTELSEPVQRAAEVVFHRLLERMAAHAVARLPAEVRWEVPIKAGRVQLSAELYDRLFEGREGVVPFVLDDAVCLMPVQQVTGGLLVKIRTPRGDRAVDAAEFLRAQGWDDLGTYVCAGRWEPTLGALALTRTEPA